MKTLKEVTVDDSISLSKLTGMPIKDVLGYISMEFGEPCFKMVKIVLDDNSAFWAEGEHDMPYLTDGYGDNAAKFDEEELQSIYDEENGEDSE